MDADEQSIERERRREVEERERLEEAQERADERLEEAERRLEEAEEEAVRPDSAGERDVGEEPGAAPPGEAPERY